MTSLLVDTDYLDEKIKDLATIEELTAGAALISGQGFSFGAVATSAPVWIAPFACEISWAALVAGYGYGDNVLHSLSDTKYWTVVVRRWRAGTSTVIATKTTRLSAGMGDPFAVGAFVPLPAGEAAVNRRPWTFHAASFDATTAVLQPDDMIDFAFYPTRDSNLPAAWGGPMYGQIAYRPL